MAKDIASIGRWSNLYRLVDVSEFRDPLSIRVPLYVSLFTSRIMNHRQYEFAVLTPDYAGYISLYVIETLHFYS
jgi:hypothetical protein